MEQQEFETGIEPEVSEDSFEADNLNNDPILSQYATEKEQQRWKDELSACRKERREFDDRAVKIVKRYADIREETNKAVSKYNLLFANVDTKASALFARIPTPDIKRRFDDADDAVSRVAANILRRNIVYELETGDFEQKFKNIIWDRLVPGIGIGWARLEQDIGEPEQTLTYDQFGNQIITNIPESEIKDQLAAIDYVSWSDFFSAPCQVWTECRWIGRRIPMNKAAIESRFKATAPAKTLQELNYEKEEQGNDQTNPSSKLKPKNVIQETVDVYEIWDKETRLIFWIAEAADVPLDVKADTNEFDNFFPTPLPPLGRFTTSSTIAISDYSLVQDLYRDLDTLQDRMSMLAKALQLKWVYDSGNAALKELYTTSPELSGIGIKDWAAQMGEKGGLRNAIEFAPLEEIADTYQKCLAAQQQVKQQIWEIEAIPDFIRGETQAYDSAAATQQKGQFGTSRLSTYQHDVAKYAEQLIRLKAHLICKFYKPEIIMQRAGALSQADTPLVPQAIQLLKDSLLQSFKLEISVDAIQLPNWNLERQDRTQLVTAVGQALGQLMQVTQGTPELAPLGMHLLKFAVSGYKGAADIEGYIDQGLAQMIQTLAASKGQPPKPSPAEMQAQAHQQRIQGDIQVAQIQESSKQQIAQLNAQVEAMKVDAKKRESELQAQLDTANLALKAFQVKTQAHDNMTSQHLQAHDQAHNAAIELANLGATTGGQ